MQEGWSVGASKSLLVSRSKRNDGKVLNHQHSLPTSREQLASPLVVGTGTGNGNVVVTESGSGKEERESVSKVRSLSMSRNLALSVVDEVPHMIRLSPSDTVTVEVKQKFVLKKSLSASSLTRLLLIPSSSTSVNLSASNTMSSSNTSANVSANVIEGASERDFLMSQNLNCKNVGASASGSTPTSAASAPLPSSSCDKIIHPTFEPEDLTDTIGKLELRSLSDESSVKNLIGGKRNDLLVGVVVSRWDNIVGPQCVYLWTEERTSTFYPGNLPLRLSRVVKYVTDHTVDHHDVDGDVDISSTLRSTLCIVRDLDLAYLSVSIRVPLDPESENSFGFSQLTDRNRPAPSVPHSVAVLADLQYLSHFLLLRPLVLNWLSEFSPKIGVLLCKSQLQSSMINSWCAELCKTMTALTTCWWQESHCPAVKNTELVTHHGSSSMLSSMAGSSTEEQDDGSPTPSEFLPPSSLNKTVVEALLASFLTTFGSAIVVGEDAAAVNQVIRFLLCFAKDQEAYCSRYVLPTLPDTFMKGLLVQGLMLGEIGAKSISYNQVTSNRYPFTYIELSRKQVKVKQTNLQYHRSQREAILREELDALWKSSALGSSSTDPFQQVVKEGCSFLNKFLDELRLLRPERRYARLLLFKRSLHAKAIALIAFLESIRFKLDKERLKGLKSITSALGFDDAEYAIVQVAAEKIRPGIQAIIKYKFKVES